jgi:DNA-binding MarR family transcriptional regulator
MDDQGPDSKENQGRCRAPDFLSSFSIFTLARAHRGLAAQLLHKLGLYSGQELILMQLWERDGQSQHDLVHALHLDHSTIAKSMRRLEGAGLVTRCRGMEDGRVTVVTLTPVGWELQPQVQAVWEQLEAVTTQSLTPQEKAQFTALSQKMRADIESVLHCD